MVFAVVFTYLSNAFGCISHELLIAKSNAFGFDKKSFTFPFISINEKNKTKIGFSFSNVLNMFFGCSSV